MPLEAVVSAILYRLKTGCQWRELPIKQFFHSTYSWKSVYYHFRKWCRNGNWERLKEGLFEKYKTYLDLSCVQLDGSHTPAKQGGERVGYQGRKRCKTTNMLFLCDNQGIPLGCSQAIDGNHNDLFEIENHVDEILSSLKRSSIKTDYLFINADAGFDSEHFRKFCTKKELVPNIAFNKRNGNIADRNVIFDEKLYTRRFVIERMNAWLDGFKALLMRFETRALHWKCIHIIAFCLILIRKL
ncbi:IS5 family transposase [Chryseobacterium sp. Bi04]|uniref:IS5 family transposase n=1 Tax=Chryseobacterium sp. Bi04 TaxID=2822345 RepID=UPI001D3A5FE1|nr:IS5 family transposase [Chryseobacterium sp. Bi04]CAH0201139.1 hypothetical protein SRABI04_01984 [Chryseobacterium sp. Bi04]